MIIKRPPAASKRALVSLLVIALATVIASAQAGSISEHEKPAAVVGLVPSAQEAQKVVAQEPVKQEAPSSAGDTKPELKAPEGVQQGAALDAPASVSVDEKPTAAAAGESASVAAAESSSDAAGKRKGRAEQSTSSSQAASTGDQGSKSTPAAASAEKSAATADKSSAKAAEQPAKLEGKAAVAKPSKPQALAGKSATKSKLPANLGTVTSTGSGGPAHYMSKHDAYSAIAEKHGALAQDAMRKSDKRSQIQSFGGIQKASGLGDMFGDTGLARTLGASMRSIIKGKYSVPAYVASALLGAVALLAFYESPISPLPVPPLPEPPVGRFPPEMPNISPNVQVPFRTNQQQQYGQQNYNQRSYGGLPQQLYPQQSQQQQQQQQILFPGAQQRQMGPATVPGGVQQLAANLLSGVAGKQQVAQRKSSPDYEQQSISRSLFSSSPLGPAPKMSSPVNSQKAGGNSFLSFFGLGGGASSAPSPSTAPSSGELAQAAGPSGLASGSDSKNQATANGLSNSHLVNKVKSYFTRASPTSGLASSSSSSSSASSGSSSSANANPYDQYQRMSFVQALMKDTAFLPGFLSSNRKSSPSPSSSSSANSQSSNMKAQSVTNAVSGGGGNGPAARMQVDSGLQSLGQNLPSINKPAKSASSGFGLARTADRIAHALLETFTSGIAQRSAHNSNTHSSSSTGDSDRKSGSHSGDEHQGNQAASLATSLISDLMYSYSANAAQAAIDQSQQQHQADQQAKSAQQQSSQQQQQPSADQSQNARSDADEEHSANSQNTNSNKQQAASLPAQSNQENSAVQQQAHVRKTRSVGFEYPIETNQELALREQQPSKAAQINNVIDFVADSYTNNRLLFNFVMNQVGLSQAVPYVEQILASGSSDRS